MKNLHIELDLAFDDSADDQISVDVITDTVLINAAMFWQRMQILCEQAEPRANLIEDSLAITYISLSDQGRIVSVEFEYEAYYGCKDMDHSDAVQDEWEFDIIGNKLIFDLDIPDLERDDEI
jgi:hypothetical protein